MALQLPGTPPFAIPKHRAVVPVFVLDATCERGTSFLFALPLFIREVAQMAGGGWRQTTPKESPTKDHPEMFPSSPKGGIGKGYRKEASISGI